MAGTIRQLIARRRSSAVNEYVAAMKNEYLEKVSAPLYVPYCMMKSENAMTSSVFFYYNHA